VVDAVDVIALVIVAALVSGNDRVVVIPPVSGEHVSACSPVPSPIVDGIDHVHAADHVPERGHDQGSVHVQGSDHGLQNGKGR
jgi:hypothetical protein